MTTTPSPSLPKDKLNLLLTAWHDPSATLPDIAQQMGITLTQLAALVKSPEIAKTIDELDALAKRRAESLAINARAGAIDRLDLLVRTTSIENPRDREIVRKAAANLITASEPQRPQRTAAAKPSTDPEQFAKMNANLLKLRASQAPSPSLSRSNGRDVAARSDSEGDSDGGGQITAQRGSGEGANPRATSPKQAA